MPGIEKRPARLHHLRAVTRVPGALVLYRQKIYIALFRPVKLMSLWTDKRFLRARQRRVAKGTTERHDSSRA
ncbi:Uncharacterised protein [Enterobacter cloacae]|nr:Uncharacterised protein [Enterobacter cloacae]